MVFQDPMSSLNPVLTVERQLTEGIREHLGLGRRAARERAVELLDRVGIPDPRGRLDAYPHQLSGGMRQRVMIAIALACEPQLLIADEATTALDVTIQAQIVELLAELQSELGMAMIWITHDLGVVAGIADRVLIMYAGRVVEEGTVDEIFDSPRHPYTRGLLGSLPAAHSVGDSDLQVIPGLPPDPTALPPGCAFWPRCSVRGNPRCESEVPPLRPAGSGTHRVATFYEEDR
jgi:peptide/nickel transport system ATP-binding protein